ncbi:MAG: phosphatase PAP2 family protein [Gemmatimonadota bacterium]|nr:MAG: phosphatase PAP2 family protein [Gemmatimonadota bacterium]
MSRLKRRLAKAQPADLVFLGYVLLSGLLVGIFGYRVGPTVWLGLSLAHAALLAVGLWWSGRPLQDRTSGGFLRDIYPFLFIVYLYWELRYLALLFTTGYHDPLILRLEESLFGEQLAMTFSERVPNLWLSELFHLSYAFYWVQLPLAAVALYLRGRIAGFRELAYVELVVFFGCYLVFIFFPVAGPHYQFPVIDGPLAEGFFFQLVHAVLEDGGSKGAAFPSSHVAVAVTILLVSWRHDRLVCGLMALPVIALTVGTVYGRFHYGVDALSGVLAAVILVSLARRMRPRLEAVTRKWAGNSGRGSPV